MGNANNFSTFLSTVNEEDPPASQAVLQEEPAEETLASKSKRLLGYLNVGPLSGQQLLDRANSDGVTFTTEDFESALSYLMKTEMVEQPGNEISLTPFAKQALNIFHIA